MPLEMGNRPDRDSGVPRQILAGPVQPEIEKKKAHGANPWAFNFLMR